MLCGAPLLLRVKRDHAPPCARAGERKGERLPCPVCPPGQPFLRQRGAQPRRKPYLPALPPPPSHEDAGRSGRTVVAPHGLAKVVLVDKLHGSVGLRPGSEVGVPVSLSGGIARWSRASAAIHCPPVCHHGVCVEVVHCCSSLLFLVFLWVGGTPPHASPATSIGTWSGAC